MKTAIITIHGINSFDGGEYSVDRFSILCKAYGIIFEELDYRWVLATGAALTNKSTAELLRDKINELIHDYDLDHLICIGHSNGCAIMHLASNLHQFTNKAVITYVYLNPALANNLAPGPDVDNLNVWYTPSDLVVKGSKMFYSFIPKPHKEGRPWGDMGAVGYKGRDNRVSNFKYDDYGFKNMGHCGIFDDSYFKIIGNKIVANALQGASNGSTKIQNKMSPMRSGR